MRPILISLLLLATLPSFAADLCDQISPLTCSPGKLDDGTGSASAMNTLTNSSFSDLLKEREKKIYADTIKKLDSIPRYHLEMALSATGAGARQVCAGTLKGQNATPDCKKLVAEGITQRILGDLAGGEWNPDSNGDGPELSDEYYLRDSTFYQGLLQKHNEEARKESSLPELEKHLRDDLFPTIKKTLLDVVSKKVPDLKQRRFMLNKIKAIEFGGTDCNINDNKLANEFTGNAFYLTDNRFHFCKGFSRLGLSDFTAAFFMAHELAHSIDPCFIQHGPSMYNFKYSTDDPMTASKEYPVKGLLSCLRDPRSIGAQQVQAQGNHYHNTSSKPFCKADQIGEATADWYATEVTARLATTRWKSLNQTQFRNGLANVFRPTCNPGTGLKTRSQQFDVHPHPMDRQQNLLLTHPRLRSRLNCGPIDGNKKIYCDENYQIPQAPNQDMAEQPYEVEQ